MLLVDVELVVELLSDALGVSGVLTFVAEAFEFHVSALQFTYLVVQTLDLDLVPLHLSVHLKNVGIFLVQFCSQRSYLLRFVCKVLQELRLGNLETCFERVDVLLELVDLVHVFVKLFLVFGFEHGKTLVVIPLQVFGLALGLF